MSLQRETVRTYRKLYRKVQEVGSQCGLVNKSGLTAYVSHRFRLACDAHRQLLIGLMSENRVNLKGLKKRRRQREIARQFREYETYLSAAVDHSKIITENLSLAPGNPQLTSLLQVLGSGIGNTAYREHVESNFIALAQHESRKEEREELAEQGTDERKNRILQQAILPFAEKLLLAHRAGLRNSLQSHQQAVSHFHPVTETGLSALTKWQMIEAMVGTRVGVSAHHVRLLGDDEAVVEIDETYNKQTIYVVCQRRSSVDTRSSSNDRARDPSEKFTGNICQDAGSSLSSGLGLGKEESFSTDGFAWEEKVERVDIAESEEVRRTIFSSAFLTRATRLCNSLEAESPLHRSRKTVVVGHGVGGAVALTASLLLLNRGFDLTNVITFGALKSLQGGTLDRYLQRVNPVRVVLQGDPLVDFPVSGSEGYPFVHVGEVLLLSPLTSSLSPDVLSGLSTLKNSSSITTSTALPSLSDSFSRSSVSTPTAAAVKSGNNRGVEEDATDEEKEDDSGLLKVRSVYRSRFLIEHYVDHLSNMNIPVSYSEKGEENWDDGDYLEMRRRNGTI